MLKRGQLDFEICVSENPSYNSLTFLEGYFSYFLVKKI